MPSISSIDAAAREFAAWWEGLPAPKGGTRIFVTGVYGSGKSHLARRLARALSMPLVRFDQTFCYASSANQSRAFLESLPASCVVDAIPIDEGGTWSDFRAYEAETSPVIVCVYCPEQGRWVRRVVSRDFQIALGRHFVRQVWSRLRRELSYLKRSFRRLGPRTLTLRDELEQKSLQAFRRFYTENVQVLSGFQQVRYFDSLRNEWTTREEMARRLRTDLFPLQQRLRDMGGVYDVSYQDIEVLAASGYSDSHRTWERISGLLDWKGRRVTDLGCFHGYFSFKVEDAGGRVLGLDRSPDVLDTARMINEARQGKVEFRQWVGGDPVPDSDIVLCLNVLHHFGDDAAQGAILAALPCETVLFEVDRDRVALIQQHFGQVTLHPSHRKDRVLLVATSQRRSAPSHPPV